MIERTYINILISGDIASGKSSIAKGVADTLGWDYESLGTFFREYHKEHNIPLYHRNAIPKEVDLAIDSAFTEKIRTTPDTVFEAHFQGWLSKDIPTAFRVLIKTDFEVALERASGRTNIHTESREDLIKRKEELHSGFKSLYGDYDYLDPILFNLTIDNTHNTLEESVQEVVKQYTLANNSIDR